MKRHRIKAIAVRAVNFAGAQRIDNAHHRYHGNDCPAPTNKTAICDRREQVAQKQSFDCERMRAIKIFFGD